jgi:hypothetical protein
VRVGSVGDGAGFCGVRAGGTEVLATDRDLLRVVYVGTGRSSLTGAFEGVSESSSWLPRRQEKKEERRKKGGKAVLEPLDNCHFALCRRAQKSTQMVRGYTRSKDRSPHPTCPNSPVFVKYRQGCAFFLFLLTSSLYTSYQLRIPFAQFTCSATSRILRTRSKRSPTIPEAKNEAYALSVQPHPARLPPDQVASARPYVLLPGDGKGRSGRGDDIRFGLVCVCGIDIHVRGRGSGHG